MNGWWWNPAEPGRGFFVDYRGGDVRVACCLYAADGKPSVHRVGPVALGAGDDISEGDFRLKFAGGSSAALDWNGVRIALEPQHPDKPPHAEESDRFTGWWSEAGADRALACEQVGRRIFGALLAGDGWTLLEAARQPDGSWEGKWFVFEGGQPLGGAHRLPAGRELPGGARLALDAAGDLVVRLPDGSERVFRQPPGGALRERPARALTVRFGTHATERVTSGLAGITFEIETPSFTDAAYRLVLESTQPGVPRCETELRIRGWSRTLVLLLNTHLLPNGRMPLAARITKDGADLWRGSFSVSVSNTGPLAEQVRASLRERGVPLAIAGMVDSTDYDMGNAELRPWFDREDAAQHIERLKRDGRIDEAEAAALRQFAAEGYMILPEPVEEDLLAKIDRELDDVIAKKVQGYEYGKSQRIRNLHERYAGVHGLWRHPKVMRFLELVFGVPARPCQTLTYIFGSQQEAHQDTVHLTPFPAGYMCGVWVALEDVKPDSGELEVFPGTHKLPRVYVHDADCPKVTDDDWSEFGEKLVKRYQRMLDEGGFGKVTYRPKRGTVLVWHENLLHGGSVRIDQSLSRRSIVSHYFADGSIAFYDSTGLPGNMAPA